MVTLRFVFVVVGVPDCCDLPPNALPERARSSSWAGESPGEETLQKKHEKIEPGEGTLLRDSQKDTLLGDEKNEF